MATKKKRLDTFVWVLILSHRFGIDTDIYATKKRAEKALYEYMELYWDEKSDEEMPKDLEEATKLYFHDEQDEWYTLRKELVK